MSCNNKTETVYNRTIYSVLEVQNLKDLLHLTTCPSLAASSNLSKNCVVDCRKLPLKDVQDSSLNICRLLQNPNVCHVWVDTTNVGDFFALKNRMLKLNHGKIQQTNDENELILNSHSKCNNDPKQLKIDYRSLHSFDIHKLCTFSKCREV